MDYKGGHRPESDVSSPFAARGVAVRPAVDASPVAARGRQIVRLARSVHHPATVPKEFERRDRAAARQWPPRARDHRPAGAHAGGEGSGDRVGVAELLTASISCPT